MRALHREGNVVQSNACRRKGVVEMLLNARPPVLSPKRAGSLRWKAVRGISVRAGEDHDHLVRCMAEARG
jgi:hypothetical protein